MLKTRLTLIDAITSYSAALGGEDKIKADFLDLLAQPRCFARDHLPGHVTGSAWILNKELTKTVLIFHKKLQRWLQPGGHADGEEDVLSVAMREAEEETGLNAFTKVFTPIFDLDIHPIPDRKDFPAHLHYDVRFALIADEGAPLIISDESTGLKWIDIASVEALTGSNPSMMRMVSKTTTLHHTLQPPPSPTLERDRG